MAVARGSALVLLLLSPSILTPVSAATSTCAIGTGQKGLCQSTSSCKSNGGTSTPGYCRGLPADVQCCTYGACEADGQTGLCIPTSGCSGKATPNHCPGPANVQCCTYGSCRTSIGQAGMCERKSKCTRQTIAGLCPGPAEIQCCYGAEPTVCNEPWPKVNQATIDLVIRWEHWEPEIYPDPNGHPTVGYGHRCPEDDLTCSKIGYPIPLSKADGEALLQEDLFIARRCLTVDLLDTARLNPNQYGALVSWVFNVGCGNMHDSTLRQRLNAGEDPNTVARSELPQWKLGSDNKVLQGLIERRAQEVALFTTATSGIAHPPCS